MVNPQRVISKLMNAKRAFSVLLTLVVIFGSATFSSCKSNKATCEANRHNKSKTMKKNRSNYGSRYTFKYRPVHKDYVIRNGR